MADTPTVTVPVASPWYSKINWTQVVSGAAMVLSWLTGGALGLDATQQLALVTSIGVIGNIVTWIMRTWFTKTVTPQSVK